MAPDLATDVPDQVLREVLCNLLSNALNVLPEGGTVAIAAERRERIVHLVVRDTGPGLDERLADDLFAAGATTGRGLGRGYGLHVSRRILTDHGGDLTHVRPADGGAAFRLEMPATDPAPAAMADTDALTSDLDPGTVVVVDDDAAMREMLNDVLQALGQQVTVLPDAASALAACAVGTWQVAFVDVKLPDRSGRDLAAQLRRRDPALAVVLVSGWGTDIDDAAADPAVDLTARKPLSLATITQLLENGQRLNRRRREEDARTQWPEDDGAPE